MSAQVQALEARTRRLLASDRVTAPTRAALTARLAPVGDVPGVLGDGRLAVLAAIAARLVPLGGLEETLQLARRYDVELARGPGDGWRYAAAPPDVEAAAAGLDALEAAAGPGGFPALPPERQDALLEQARTGAVDTPAHWFEETLATLVRLAYAHPLLQVAIGYDGMADAHGFQDLDAPSR